MKTPKKISDALQNRKNDNALRTIKSLNYGLVDFCSNDYLGLQKLADFELFLKEKLVHSEHLQSGSGGSRLISGNFHELEQLECKIAQIHKAESALLFSSGYLANVGLLSSVPQRGDTVLYDEYCHTSLKDGMRLSHAQKISFRHNDLQHLQHCIQKSQGSVFIVVESVYSMDGDFAPLIELVEIAGQNSCYLIVDEAHAGGIYGENGAGRVVELHLAENVFARIITYGKAYACQGGAILGNKTLREFLVNFCRPFIYTTAPSPLQVLAIDAAYEYISLNSFLVRDLHERISFFQENSKTLSLTSIVPSLSAIQKIIISGNGQVKVFAERLCSDGYSIVPILAPTVPEGKERIRITLHNYNSHDEILKFLIKIQNYL